MPTSPSTRWLCISPLDGGGQRVVVVASGRYPDGMRVDLPPAPADAQIAADALAEVRLDAGGTVTSLRVMPAAAPKAPPLWFAELPETAAHPPAVNLLAFTGAGRAPDTLVDRAALSGVAVTSGDQLGALRWWPGSGEVDQVYVQPQWRRRSIGTVLVLAASGLAHARGWARPWGDGQRTELGEAWRNQSFWRDRTQPLTHVAPPMTPAAENLGTG